MRGLNKHLSNKKFHKQNKWGSGVPTLPNMMIPAPRGWEEFESIVKSALEIKWGTSNLTMHGRQGQKQNGVDIYGDDDLGRLVGVQCKLTASSIDEKIIDKEISLAEEFCPSITALYIATTSPSDVKLQHYIRSISSSRAQVSKFSVRILFWSDIIDDLTKDINAFKRHYPQIPLQDTSDNSAGLDYRSRDVENIKGLLNYIDIERIPHLIGMAPSLVHSDFICEPDVFNPIRANPTFYIHDEELKVKLNSWLDKWCEIVRSGLYVYEYQLGGGENLKFPMPGDRCRNIKENALYEKLIVLYQEFNFYLYDFTNFVHISYPEINIRETSFKARQWNAQFSV